MPVLCFWMPVFYNHMPVVSIDIHACVFLIICLRFLLIYMPVILHTCLFCVSTCLCCLLIYMLYSAQITYTKKPAKTSQPVCGFDGFITPCELEECEKKYTLSKANVEIFLSDYLEENFDLYTSTYSTMLLGFVDYCWYHKAEDLRKPGPLTPEEEDKYQRKKSKEDAQQIAIFEYKNIFRYLYKSDSKSLYSRCWMSNQVVDTVALMLNIRNLRKGSKETFFFPTDCFVSKNST